jgi:hypothetical protein
VKFRYRSMLYKVHNSFTTVTDVKLFIKTLLYNLILSRTVLKGSHDFDWQVNSNEIIHSIWLHRADMLVIYSTMLLHWLLFHFTPVSADLKNSWVSFDALWPPCRLVPSGFVTVHFLLLWMSFVLKSDSSLLKLETLLFSYIWPVTPLI